MQRMGQDQRRRHSYLANPKAPLDFGLKNKLKCKVHGVGKRRVMRNGMDDYDIRLSLFLYFLPMLVLLLSGERQAIRTLLVSHFSLTQMNRPSNFLGSCCS
jgi:hypothetical protein